MIGRSTEVIRGFELSPQQKRLWALMQDERGPFWSRAAILIEGDLDRERLRAALRGLVERHEILRTTFQQAPFQQAPERVFPLQVIADPEPLALPYHDLRGVDRETQRELWLSLLCKQEAASPAVDRGPVLRACLAELSAGRHLLLLSLPALCADAAMLALLHGELSAAYRRIAEGRRESGEPLQYADLSQWQNELLANNAARGAVYWRPFTLAEGPAEALPGERRPARPVPFAPGTVAADWPVGLAAEIRGLAAQIGGDEAAVLLAGWQALLGRLGAGDQTIVGTLFDGRSHEDLRPAFGLLSKLLPVAADCAPAQPFIELVRKTGAVLRQHLDWQDLFTPSAEGDPRLFAFEHRPQPPDSSAGGLRFSLVESAACIDRFKLKLLCVESHGALRVELQYDPACFDRASVLAMAGLLERLVGNGVRQPGVPIGEIRILDEAAAHWLRYELNDTAAALGPPTPLLHDLFARQARRTPGAVALELAGATLTYGDLDAAAERLAHHLRALGVGPERRVGICLEPSPEMMIALLAVLKAGGAYLPLDPAYPADRLALMIRDTEAAVLLTREALRGSLPGHDAPIVLLDAGWQAALPAPAGPLPGPDPDNAAYVIFTSGSTGAPKGVVVSHRAICNRLLWMIATFPLTAEDRFVQKTPFSFDASIWELFVPLWIGARLVLARAGGQQDPPYLLQLLAEREITVLQMVPSLLKLLLQDGGLSGCRSLRHVFSGGETLPFDTQRQVFAQTGAGMVNLYGPTEAAIDATYWVCDRAADPGGVPIGRPIANDQVYVVERGLELAAPGVPGELWIGGTGLARGYLKRPDLTAERFVPDPFGDRPGARLYRTGDLARHRSAGEIEVIGRIDHQVKLHGVRIELGEIEASLALHAAVRQALVVVREDTPGERRLVAYLVTEPKRVPASEELRRFLEGRLPATLIPSAFVVLPELPRLPNGKIDRGALPPPVVSRTYVAPGNEIERRLAEIWSTVLGVPQVGIEDNFFGLGGDSILSIQIVSLSRAAGLRFAPRQLFEHQTVAALAAVVDASTGERLAQEPVVGPVPLTPIQHDFFARGLSDPHHYNQSVLLEVRQPLASAACSALVAGLLQRHDILRARFTREGEGWRQVVQPPGTELPFAVVDLSGLLPADRSRAVEAAAEEAQASLDLAAGPLVRALRFTVGAGAGPREHGRLLLVIHHLLIDGVSWRIVLDDLQQGWQALAAGQPAPAPDKTASYQLWAERLAAEAPALRHELDHWLAAPRRAAPPLPIDLPALPAADLEAAAETLTVTLEPAETKDLLTRIPEIYRASLYEALLTALAQALSPWMGGPVLVDLEGHGREEIFPEVDLSRTVGWFTSVFPVLLDPGRVAGAGAALRRIKEQMRGVPRNGIGYGILRYLDAEAGERLRSLPVAQIGFNYLGQLDRILAADAPFGPAPESSGRGQSRRQTRRYRLDLNALIAGDRLTVSWSYSRLLHRRETIERLADRFLAALRALLVPVAAEAGGYVPADFPLARSLDQGALDRLAADGPAIEDVYPLAPLQQGLLFDIARSPQMGAYVQQLDCSLNGTLAEDLFRQAWQRLVDRHTLLRTGFVWEGLEEPLQVVRHQAELPWRQFDWRGLAAEEQAARLERLLDEDRAQGFAIGRPPLMRLALIRLDEQEYELVWTSHHLVLDGWSVPLLVEELTADYAALCAGREPAATAAVPYRRYIDWLLRQDLREAETHWRRVLRGFSKPTPIGRAAAGPGGGHRQRTLDLPAALTAELRSFSQRHQLTLNILVQGAWALLLSCLSGTEDLVFGIVVSGRPAGLEDSGSMVGMFVNTLPVRVRVEASAPLLSWLGRLQGEQAEARQFEHAPLVAIRGWSEIAAGQPLFESTFAFNNYPTTDALRREGSAFALTGVRWREQTSYPLDFTVGLGAQLVARIMYDPDRVQPAEVEDLATGFEALLTAVVEVPERSVGELVELLEARRTRRTAAKGDSVIESPMFKKIKPKAVSLPTADVVSHNYLDPAVRLPLVIQPAGEDVDLADWAKAHREQVESDLTRHGAILFRGFQIDTPPVFERFAASVCDELFNENGEHPRESVSGNVYTPVFYPAEKQLLWHNENSFNHSWPSKILFCCAHPAETGGETPVVDSRRVFDGLDPAVRDPFVAKGIVYVRNYGGGVGLDWQTVFGTSDRERVEEQCRASRTDFEWKAGDRLKTLAGRPAVLPHPTTGEMSWFNQAQHWHISCLDEATRDSVRSLFPAGDEPRNCYYGDGSEIPDAALEHILETYRRLESCFPWQRGDVMLLDNVLAAHGRNEYTGKRKLLVALGDMTSFAE